MVVRRNKIESWEEAELPLGEEDAVPQEWECDNMGTEWDVLYPDDEGDEDDDEPYDWLRLDDDEPWLDDE